MYLMGIDVGTSSTKVLIIDYLGRTIAKSSVEYPIESPLEGYAEQNPEAWWTATKISVKRALEGAGIRGDDISAVGFSGQMHGTVLLGRDGKPLRDAIIWLDKRSINECNEIYESIGKEKTLSIVSNPVMPGFTGPTLLWIKKNEPHIFNKIFKVLLPKDYVRFRLTGSLNTDFSDASATLLFDVGRREWSDHIINGLSFPRDVFPDVLESKEIAGEVKADSSEETGLSAGTPVVTGGGDSQVGAMGCSVIEPGLISSNIGTGGQIFAAIDEFRFDPKYRVHTFCHVVPKKWCLQGAILSAGLSLRWFKDNFAQAESITSSLCGIDPYDLLSREAELSEPGCSGLVFLPYLSGERSPHMDPSARGGFFGLTLNHRRHHFIRAIMEGVVFALRDCIEVFKELGVSVEGIIARGGGAKSDLWLQIQADIFNSRVLKVGVEEDPAFGAALLAGIGVGVYRDFKEACEKTIKFTAVKHPNEERAKIYDRIYTRIYRNLYHSLRLYWDSNRP
ncbi:MAG: xylulokinase [Candidatus Bathyarchaeota archaeon]|nr:xylulokinase [Candidatus Bathyarchaeota archaeon]